MEKRQKMRYWQRACSFTAAFCMMFSWLFSGWSVSAETIDDAAEELVCVVSAEDYAASEGTMPIATEEGLVVTEETTWLEWVLTVPQAGEYAIRVFWHNRQEDVNPAVLSVSINGEQPSDAFSLIKLPRYFVDEGRPELNSLGDEVRSLQETVPGDYFLDLQDDSGAQALPLTVSLQAGENRIRFSFLRESVVLKAVALVEPTTLPSYEQLSQTYANLPSAAGEDILFEAEDIDRIVNRSAGSIMLDSNADPSASPQSIRSVKYNVLGGYSWRTANQAVTWKFHVQRSGLYKLTFRVIQSSGDGLPSTRQIMIDGAVPVQELATYEFPYSRDWYTHTLSTDEGEPLYFYLEEGDHTLTMTVKLGRMAQVLEHVQDMMDDSASLYRRIIAITGNDPDVNYDYELDKLIPDLSERIADLRKQAEICKENLLALANKTPSCVSNLDVIIEQLQEVDENPDKIPSRLGDLSGISEMLGSLLTTLKQQSLGLDQVRISGEDVDCPNYRSSFWQKLSATFQNFLWSFFKDYSGISQASAQGKTQIKVWIARGKEWGEVLTSLVESSFCRENPDIGVVVNLLPSGSTNEAINPLILAISSGTAPDVVLGLSTGLPVEYAMRHAVYDLSSFSDFEEVKQWFLSETFTSLTYNEGVYALPETTNFKCIFYRTDIFEERGLTVPETWDEVYYQLLPALNRESMQFSIPASLDLFLFQNNGSYYTEDLTASALDTDEAFLSFQQVCELYTNYGIPISANFFNRFRTGEMPIGIGDFSFYLSLITSAPELDGKWDLALIPGTKREDGTITRACSGVNGTTCVIVNDPSLGQPKAEESWTFLKWWMSAEIQGTFGRSVEGRIGDSARWNSANSEVFLSLSWSKNEASVIRQMWSEARETPVLPGSYYTGRYISNALNNVIVNGKTLRESVEEAVKRVNIEMKRRREQLEDSQ